MICRMEGGSRSPEAPSCGASEERGCVYKIRNKEKKKKVVTMRERNNVNNTNNNPNYHLNYKLNKQQQPSKPLLRSHSTQSLLILVIVLVGPWLLLRLAGGRPVSASAPIRPHDSAKGPATSRRADMLPDSIYKTAPLLFGADIITDYFTEPADRKVAAQPKSRHRDVVATSSMGLKSANIIGQASTTPRQSRSASSTGQTQSSSTKPLSSSSSSSASHRTRQTLINSNKPTPTSTSLSPVDTDRMMDLIEAASDDAPSSKLSSSSMEHVLSSLGMAMVEAMKQQTMAMQMISGQMAVVKSGPSSSSSSSTAATTPTPTVTTSTPTTPASTSTTTLAPASTPTPAPALNSMDVMPALSMLETKKLLESFGEIMGGLRDVRQASKTAAFFQSFGETIPDTGVKTASKGGRDDLLIVNQEIVGSTAGAPTSTSKSTTTTTTTSTTAATTTTTTTTTPRPTTTTAQPSSTTTTTTTSSASYAPTAPSTTTTASTKTTTVAAPSASVYAKSFSRANSEETPQVRYKIAPEPTKGWRRVVPFDFYPSQYEDQVSSSAEPDMDHASVPMISMYSNAARQNQHSPALSLESPSSHSGETNYRSVAMPGYSATSNFKPFKSKRPAEMIQPHQMMSMMLQQQLMKAKDQVYDNNQANRAQTMSGPMMMAAMAAAEQEHQRLHQSVTEYAASQKEADQDKFSPIMAMMMDPTQQAGEQQTQSQPQQQQQSQSDQQNNFELSDEIPKPPRGVRGNLPTSTLFGLPKMSGKTSSIMTANAGGLKIGERPKFDLSNFQMLIAADVNQQKKAQMMKLMQQIESQSSNKPAEAASTQQQQQQPQKQEDLTGTASEALKIASGSTKITGDENASANEASGSAPMEWPPSKPKVQGVAPHPNGKQSTSFSILGGRFRITPHTQMLQYILEPSKFLFQQAIGQLVSGGVGGMPMIMAGNPLVSPSNQQQVVGKPDNRLRGGRRQKARNKPKAVATTITSNKSVGKQTTVKSAASKPRHATTNKSSSRN